MVRETVFYEEHEDHWSNLQVHKSNISNLDIGKGRKVSGVERKEEEPRDPQSHHQRQYLRHLHQLETRCPTHLDGPHEPPLQKLAKTQSRRWHLTIPRRPFQAGLRRQQIHVHERKLQLKRQRNLRKAKARSTVFEEQMDEGNHEDEHQFR